MRDQYAGDLSDILKFAFLRALASADRTLGVAWYYAPGDDGKVDGRHLEWRDEPAWRELDPQLYGGLSTMTARSVAALEGAPIWPEGTVFHGEPIPSRLGRTEWGIAMRAALDRADLVFLDPDNGLGEETEKHATYSEVRLFRRQGRSVVFITFPGRSAPHVMLVQHLHKRLQTEIGAEPIVTLRTNVSVPHAVGSPIYVQRQRWFTVVDADARLIERIHEFAIALRSVPRITEPHLYETH